MLFLLKGLYVVFIHLAVCRATVLEMNSVLRAMVFLLSKSVIILSLCRNVSCTVLDEWNSLSFVSVVFICQGVMSLWLSFSVTLEASCFGYRYTFCCQGSSKCTLFLQKRGQTYSPSSAPHYLAVQQWLGKLMIISACGVITFCNVINSYELFHINSYELSDIKSFFVVSLWRWFPSFQLNGLRSHGINMVEEPCLRSCPTTSIVATPQYDFMPQFTSMVVENACSWSITMRFTVICCLFCYCWLRSSSVMHQIWYMKFLELDIFESLMVVMMMEFFAVPDGLWRFFFVIFLVSFLAGRREDVTRVGPQILKRQDACHPYWYWGQWAIIRGDMLLTDY